MLTKAWIAVPGCLSSCLIVKEKENQRQLGWEREHGLRSDTVTPQTLAWGCGWDQLGLRVVLCSALGCLLERLWRGWPQRTFQMSPRLGLAMTVSFFLIPYSDTVSWVSERSTAWKQVEKETFRLFPGWIHWYVLGFHHAAELPRQPMTQHIREHFSCENTPVHRSWIPLTTVLAF